MLKVIEEQITKANDEKSKFMTEKQKADDQVLLTIVTPAELCRFINEK